MANWEQYTELSYSAADKRFDIAIAKLKAGIGKIPKLTSEERRLLEFCAGRDMKKFLKEEFEKHPILLDEDGGLVGPNPFDNERERKNEKPYIYENYGYDL